MPGEPPRDQSQVHVESLAGFADLDPAENPSVTVFADGQDFDGFLKHQIGQILRGTFAPWLSTFRTVDALQADADLFRAVLFINQQVQRIPVQDVDHLARQPI